MKKNWHVLLACSMAMSLTACGGGKHRGTETTAAPETTTAATEAAKPEGDKEDAE